MICLLLISVSLLGSWGSLVCTDLNSLTSPHTDQRLTGHTFLSMETRGLMICAKECLKRKRCKSFNFQTSGTCELNLNTSSEVGTLLSSDNYFYHEIDQINTAVAGMCDTHTCTKNQVCQSNSSSTVCDQCSNASECGICSNIWETSNQQFRSHGCFNGRALPHLIVNLRDVIDWNDMAKTILDCAAAAHAEGYELFGIEFWGECYGGSHSEAVLNDPVPVSLCADSCWAGTAKSNTMFVYKWL